MCPCLAKLIARSHILFELYISKKKRRKNKNRIFLGETARKIEIKSQQEWSYWRAKIYRCLLLYFSSLFVWAWYFSKNKSESTSSKRMYLYMYGKIHLQKKVYIHFVYIFEQNVSKSYIKYNKTYTISSRTKTKRF